MKLRSNLLAGLFSVSVILTAFGEGGTPYVLIESVSGSIPCFANSEAISRPRASGDPRCPNFVASKLP